MKNLLALLFGGILIGAGLVVQDEILTLAMYCGVTCLYPYPFLGAFHLYDAEIIAFAMMLVGIALFIGGCAYLVETIYIDRLYHDARHQRGDSDQSSNLQRSGNKGV